MPSRNKTGLGGGNQDSSLRFGGDRIRRAFVVGGLVFTLCAATGLMSGLLFKGNDQPTSALAANIVVTNNDQSVEVDESTGIITIVRDSTVTVTNPQSTAGYTLRAEIHLNNITGATGTIHPRDTLPTGKTSPCTSSSPCNLANPTNPPSGSGLTPGTGPATILSTTNSAVGGDTTVFQVTIRIPAGTPIGSYLFDIAYSEDHHQPTITHISPTANTSGGDIYIEGHNFIDIKGDDNKGLSNGGGIAIIGTPTNNGITVNGTPCLSYRILSPTRALCTLPELPDNTNTTPYQVQLNSTTIGSSTTDSSPTSPTTITYDNSTKGVMQLFARSTCDAMPMGLAQQWQDARNNARYRIKKMPDNKCWMVDNLAYAGGGTNTYGDVHTPTFTAATSASPWNTQTGFNTRYFTTNNYTGSNKNDRNGNLIQSTSGTLYNGIQCTDATTGTSPMNSKCLSYLYNWCTIIGLDSGTSPVTCSNASPAGSGTGYARMGIIGKTGGYGGESKGNTLAANQAGVNSATAGTICPAGWRIPVGQIGSTATATSNLYNEWSILNESMKALTLFTNTSSTTINGGSGWVENWLPSGPFLSTATGYFDPSALQYQSTLGVLHGSAVYSASHVSDFNLNALSGAPTISPGTSYGIKKAGIPARCVL